MKDAYINGKIIDGTKEMQVKEGYAILVEQGKIKNIVLQEEADLTGYNVIDLKANYIIWTREPKYYARLLQVLNEPDQTADPAGGLISSCPKSFKSCKN